MPMVMFKPNILSLKIVIESKSNQAKFGCKWKCEYVMEKYWPVGLVIQPEVLKNGHSRSEILTHLHLASLRFGVVWYIQWRIPTTCHIWLVQHPVSLQILGASTATSQMILLEGLASKTLPRCFWRIVLTAALVRRTAIVP